jgi:phosphoribosylglycinamide formyltransferase-1
MSSKKFTLAILASGSGTNAEEIFKYFKGHPAIEAGLLMSNNPKAFVLQRAKNHDVKSVVFSREEFNEGTLIRKALAESGVTHIVLAGFLRLIPSYLLESFPDRIINIHPALLPKYGGKGMYGSKVHEAVKAAGEVETGITIHLVNDQYDEGKVLFQASCSITDNHTPDQIAECVHKLEHEHYPRVIEQWVLNQLTVGSRQ